MTGYQEIMTDPSYTGQIITFTFPHIGNTGTNGDDVETIPARCPRDDCPQYVTQPSNWRQDSHLHGWLKQHGLPGISGIDTRALTRTIRDNGAPNGVFMPPRRWPSLTCQPCKNWLQTGLA